MGRLKSEYKGANHNRTIGVGDLGESIDTSDKRFDTRSVDLGKIRPDLQYDFIEELLRPYASLIDAELDGNHEYGLMRYYPYIDRMCKNLGVRYGTTSAVISYYYWKNSKAPLFKIYAHHGKGTIRSAADDPERVEANLNLSLKRKLKGLAGDCAVMMMGHTHLQLICKPKKTLYLSSNKNGDETHHYHKSRQNDKFIHPDHRWYINTGTMRRTRMRGFSDYAERFMYPPVELGHPVIMIRDGKIVDAEKVYV